MPDLYGFSGSPFSPLTITGMAGLVLLVIVLIIISRFRKASRKETLSGGAGLNLLELKKKGLLSPAEMERVSGAIIKQMALKADAERRKNAVPTPDTLLLDPEVRRLEALAVTGKKTPESADATLDPEAGYLNRRDPAPHFEENLGSNIARTESETPKLSDEEIENVELPLDIVQLVDAGLLSSEEVLNVKRRILAKRQH